MNSVLMFAYGMNTNLVSMRLRCRNAKPISRAWLTDCKLECKYHLDITREEHHIVPGVLWSLEPEDLELMDQVEGYPDYYERDQMFVRSKAEDGFGGRSVAWVYYMKDRETELAMPDSSYIKHVLEGYWQNNVDTRQLYAAIDEAKLHAFGQSV